MLTSKVPINVDILCHYSESNTVTDNTAMNSTNKMQVDTRPSSELANEIEPQSFESLIVDSISKCSSIIEQKKDILPTDVANVEINEKEAHGVIEQELLEETKKEDIETYKKVSLKSSNVASKSNLAQVIYAANKRINAAFYNMTRSY